MKYLKYFKGSVIVQTCIPKGINFKECIRNITSLGIKEIIANPTSESAFLISDKFKMNKKDFENYFKAWEETNIELINNIMTNNNFAILHIIRLIFQSLHSRIKRMQGCGVGRTISILPDGTIYPCQSLINPNYRIGDLKNGIDTKKMMNFGKQYIKYLSKCNGCWAKNICGAGCIAQSIQYNELSDEYEPSRFCNFQKKSIEFCIYLYSKIKNETPELFDIILPIFKDTPVFHSKSTFSNYESN